MRGVGRTAGIEYDEAIACVCVGLGDDECEGSWDTICRRPG